MKLIFAVLSKKTAYNTLFGPPCIIEMMSRNDLLNDINKYHNLPHDVIYIPRAALLGQTV